MKKSVLGKMIKTLLWRDLLIYALSVYIGTVMYNFFDSFVKNILLPTVNSILSLEFLETSPEELNYKQFLTEFINLIIACSLTYISIKFVQRVEN